MNAHCLASALALGFAASAGAQIVVTATTFAPPGRVDGVSVGGTTIAASTDVTAGFNLQATGASNPPWSPANATGDLVVTTTSMESVAQLTQISNSPFSNTDSTSTHSRAAIELIYASAIPVDVDITMTVPAETATSCSQQWGSVTVAGHATYSTSNAAPGGCVQDPFVFPPTTVCSQTVQATIGPAALTIQLIGDTWSSGGIWSGPCLTGSGAHSTIGVEIRPRPRTSSYGASCGATVDTSVTSLLAPATETIRIVAPPGLASGVLLIGTNQASLPLPFTTCLLLTDVTVAVPLVFPPGGDLSFAVPPPPPGLLTTQAGAFGGATIVMTNGLQW